jgi:hypothetical protein
VVLDAVAETDTRACSCTALSVEEYDSILEVAQNDPGIREKIRRRIRARSNSIRFN